MKSLKPLWCSIGLCAATVAHAHLLAPAWFELDALPSSDQAAHYAVQWRISARTLSARNLRPRLPADCAVEGAVTRSEEAGDDIVTQRWRVRCALGALEGRRVGVEGLRGSGVNVILRIQPARGRPVEALLGDGRESYTVPLPGQRPAVLPMYLRLGVTHLLTGADHLLFLLGLLVLVRRASPAASKLAAVDTAVLDRARLRALLFTVTAFTLGHSVTLSLASLQWIHVRQPLAELGIALTILALACELSRPQGERPTLLARKPWAMTFIFGLLHGLGFAGALSEIGLPQGEIPLALLAFNLGIECGQLLLLGAALLALALWLELPRPRGPALRLAERVLPVYLMGSLAVLWCLQRAALLLG